MSQEALLVLGALAAAGIFGWGYYRFLCWAIPNPAKPMKRIQEGPERPLWLQRRDARAPWNSRWRALPKVLKP